MLKSIIFFSRKNRGTKEPSISSPGFLFMKNTKHLLKSNRKMMQSISWAFLLLSNGPILVLLLLILFYEPISFKQVFTNPDWFHAIANRV